MFWVRLDDGRYVQDPIFFGKEWFLDCRLEPMLVVRIYREPKETSLLKRMRKILREAGVAATIMKDEESHRDIYPFPPKFQGLKQSASVRLELKDSPIPAGLPCHASVWAKLRPEGEVLNECIKSPATDG